MGWTGGRTEAAVGILLDLIYRPCSGGGRGWVVGDIIHFKEPKAEQHAWNGEVKGTVASCEIGEIYTRGITRVLLVILWMLLFILTAKENYRSILRWDPNRILKSCLKWEIPKQIPWLYSLCIGILKLVSCCCFSIIAFHISFCLK